MNTTIGPNVKEHSAIIATAVLGGPALAVGGPILGVSADALHLVGSGSLNSLNLADMAKSQLQEMLNLGTDSSASMSLISMVTGMGAQVLTEKAYSIVSNRTIVEGALSGLLGMYAGVASFYALVNYFSP